MMRTIEIEQNPYIGVLSATNDKWTLIPDHVSKKEGKVFHEVLGTEVISCNISSLSLLGTLVAMNSDSIIVPYDIDFMHETDKLDINITNTFKTRFNAFGNNILINDHFALVHKGYSKSDISKLADIFDVEIEKGSIAGLSTVGTAAVVTNKGMLVHPLTQEEELDFLQNAFKVECEIGTANFGVGNVGACLVANSKGAVIGSPTTGIELGKIEDALKLYT